MTASAGFVPERLRLARDLQKLSQSALARQVGLTPAAVSKFESGETTPSASTLTALATALSMPVGYFDVPVEETHEGFFRSLRKSTVSQRRRARSLAHLVHDLAATVGAAGWPALNLPRYPVDSLDADTDLPAQAAREVRARWCVPAGPIHDVVALLEDHGVLVLRLPLDAADVDAFSLPFPDHPVVVLSANKDDRARSRFDAAHELGHLVMHGESVWGVKEVETQAHQFAAEFLMPGEQIAQELPDRPDWDVFFKLKQRWHVSIAALLLRARTLERMPPAAYTTAMKGLSARGWRRIEPVPLGPPESPTKTRNLLRTAQRESTWFPQALLPALEDPLNA
ncbi:helix-turn-helix domain-containing protein [Nocardioides acrostichi]|uniref:XRE family transcriptional regulator n=1 Tax=Nocardioides acrostichi TaxID=2784339 RepID=A0A930YBL0_9ACTN|nr:XRE family transcriptional regulator [Nocardioides acrostichi]MBF4162578.1 XRE family transcriptional regulator [Nocardioides acrostichi]